MLTVLRDTPIISTKLLKLKLYSFVIILNLP